MDTDYDDDSFWDDDWMDGWKEGWRESSQNGQAHDIVQQFDIFVILPISLIFDDNW